MSPKREKSGALKVEMEKGTLNSYECAACTTINLINQVNYKDVILYLSFPPQKHPIFKCNLLAIDLKILIIKNNFICGWINYVGIDSILS